MKKLGLSTIPYSIHIYQEEKKKIQAHIFNRYIHAHIYKYMIHVCAGVCTYKTNVGEIINFKVQKISSGEKKNTRIQRVYSVWLIKNLKTS